MIQLIFKSSRSHWASERKNAAILAATPRSPAGASPSPLMHAGFIV
jgi:hypothetical protein